MKKEHNFEDFDAYMRSLYSYLNDVVFEQKSHVYKIMKQHDELEVEVPSRPCYTSVEELMKAVKEL